MKTPLLLLLTLILAGGLARAADKPAFLQLGTAKVQILDETWHDDARRRNLPVRVYYPENAGKAPVVIFSHGLGGSREGYSLFGQSWASHGLVSVHLQHIGSDESLWKNEPAPSRAKALRAGATPINTLLRNGDMRFALDQLEIINAAPGPLQGRLDLEKIGVAGHSFGALTVELVTGASSVLAKTTADPRIKAVIAMSSPVPPAIGGYDQMRLPTMHMTGTEDTSPGTTAADRLIPYKQATYTPTYLANFEGGTHNIFGGRSLDPGKKLSPYQDHILGLTNAFWQAYLTGDKTAADWLGKGSATEFVKPVGKFEGK
jgi:predicted dienelactone hydrolase